MIKIYNKKINKKFINFKMLTQEDIEEFFTLFKEEMEKENIPILNNYVLKFKNYPTKEDLEKEIEEEIEKEKEYFENFEDDILEES